MSKLNKLFALLLALIITASAFVACDQEVKDDGNEEKTLSTEITTTAETEFLPDVEKKNYGENFHMLIQSGEFDYYWVEESAGDAMSESIYARQQNVYEHLGVEMTATQGAGHDQYGTPFMTAVKNKDGSIESVLSHSYMFLTTFISGGYLTDFLTVDGINLDADYWSRDVMEQVAAGDHLYLGYSDFRLPYTHVITYNKEMLERYSDSLDESMYDMVRNYRWTLDKMISLASLAYVDATADGKTDDDTFGLTGTQWMPFVGFLQSSNIMLVDMDERGDYVVGVFSEKNKNKTTDLVEKLSALSKSDYAWFRYRDDALTTSIPLYSGRTLMSLTSIFSLPNYLDYDIDFGIIPYPMFDEAQKDVGYRSLDWGGWICIPSYAENMNMVVDTLEVLSFYSKDVTITFYEKLLGKQVADAPDDRAMLDIIWDSVCADVGLTYSNIGPSLDKNLYMLPNVTHANATEEVASYVKSYETASNKLLRKFFGTIE